MTNLYYPLRLIFKAKYTVPWYISIVQTRLEVRLWCSMDHIAHTSGNEIGVQFAHLLLFVVLEVGAAVNEGASRLT